MPGKKQEKERKRKEAAAMCIKYRLVFVKEWKESISVLVMNAKEMLCNLLFSSNGYLLSGIASYKASMNKMEITLKIAATCSGLWLCDFPERIEDTFCEFLFGTVAAKIAPRLKCYKNASRLNRYNFPTDNAIVFLLSTLHSEMV